MDYYDQYIKYKKKYLIKKGAFNKIGGRRQRGGRMQIGGNTDFKWEKSDIISFFVKDGKQDNTKLNGICTDGDTCTRYLISESDYNQYGWNFPFEDQLSKSLEVLNKLTDVAKNVTEKKEQDTKEGTVQDDFSRALKKKVEVTEDQKGGGEFRSKLLNSIRELGDDKLSEIYKIFKKNFDSISTFVAEELEKNKLVWVQVSITEKKSNGETIEKKSIEINNNQEILHKLKESDNYHVLEKKSAENAYSLKKLDNTCEIIRENLKNSNIDEIVVTENGVEKLNQAIEAYINYLHNKSRNPNTRSIDRPELPGQQVQKPEQEPEEQEPKKKEEE
jgi:hypothetical protein